MDVQGRRFAANVSTGKLWKPFRVNEMKRKHRRVREMEAHADLILRFGEWVYNLYQKIKRFVTRLIRR